MGCWTGIWVRLSDGHSVSLVILSGNFELTTVDGMAVVIASPLEKASNLNVTGPSSSTLEIDFAKIFEIVHGAQSAEC